MEPRTTTISLGGEQHEIYADNATALRYEEAGGDFRRFDEKPLSNLATFIRANLVKPDAFKSSIDVVNALDDMQEAMNTVTEIIQGSRLFSPGAKKKAGESGASGGYGPAALSAGG